MSIQKMTHDSTLTERTHEAWGEGLTKQVATTHFCVLGCGAVGSLFAEMLVRSGATRISLIDGDDVETSNLNRTTGYTIEDVGVSKVNTLKKRLKNINQNVTVMTHDYMFRKPNPNDKMAREGVNILTAASVAVIAMDDRWPRYYCAKLCRKENIDQLSIGVHTKPDGAASFECAWNLLPPDPEEQQGEQIDGYGQGSYASIVMEATAAGFGMMLSNLADKDIGYNYLWREFENFKPVADYHKPAEVPSE